MTAEPFKRIAAIDFSANATPKLGSDSIWIALANESRVTQVRNISTRYELAERLSDLAALPGRLLIVIDVALGWPVGVAPLVSPDAPTRHGLVSTMTDLIEDGPRNENNRFDVANELNNRAQTAVLWGHPHGRRYRWLSPTKTPSPSLHDFDGDHLRLLERVCAGNIKSPLQLYGNGSVGSQSMLAQAMFERLRRSGIDLDVWPFDSGERHCVVVEEFFSRSLFATTAASCRDEAQVRSVASLFARDLRSGNDPLSVAGLEKLTARNRAMIHREEGWLARLAAPTQ